MSIQLSNLIVEDELIIALGVRNSVKTGELHPDQAIMDFGLKGEMDTINTATQIQARFNLPVIFLTDYAHRPATERA